MSTDQLPKQPLSVYTVMLVMSAILMFAACILMAIELVRYGGNPWEDPKIPNAPNAMLDHAPHFAIFIDANHSAIS